MGGKTDRPFIVQRAVQYFEPARSVLHQENPVFTFRAFFTFQQVRKVAILESTTYL